jgi:hypothetical protein
MPLKSIAAFGTSLVITNLYFFTTPFILNQGGVVSFNSMSNASKKHAVLSSRTKHYRACLGLSFAALSLLSSCGNMPLSNVKDNAGSLEIHTCVVNPGLAKAATNFDSLIVEVSGSDIGVIRYSKPLNLSLPVHSDTLSRIPAGIERQVKIWTVDRSGATIHMDTVSHRSIRIDPNATTQLNVVLMPALGSIYIQLENIPTKVDSIVASFTGDNKTVWCVRAKRNTKVYLSIDKITNGTHGILYVAAVDSTKDTLYFASKELTFNAASMQNISLNFTSTPGQLTMSTTVVLPGVTSATGTIAAPETSAVETGALLITEIMYAANDSEYIEVYNPSTSDLSFDSLYLDIDGTCRLFTNITVGAQRAFVFGRRPLPWGDVAHAVASALDLSSSGNWVTIRTKTGAIMDRVVFTGGSNTLEWPNVSGKQAIVLDGSINDAQANNFGRNWHAATTLISGTANQYGTPKIR